MKKSLERMNASALAVRWNSLWHRKPSHVDTVSEIQCSPHVVGVTGSPGVSRRVRLFSTNMVDPPVGASLFSPDTPLPCGVIICPPPRARRGTSRCMTSTRVAAACAFRCLAALRIADAIPQRRALSTSTPSLQQAREEGCAATAFAAGDAVCASSTPVAPVLLSEIRAVLERQADHTWLPVSDLYAALPSHIRRTHVKPHKSMTHVLQKCRCELGLSLNATGVYYAKGMMPMHTAASTEGATSAPRVVSISDQVGKDKKNSVEKASHAAAGRSDAEGDSLAISAAETSMATLPDPSLSPSKSFGPVDFFFDVDLRDIPNPPRDFDATPSSLVVDGAHSSANGAVIAIRDFVSHIPPFFVPVEEVLEHMPGYTAEHLEVYLNVKALELVTVAGERYVRLYGSYGDLSLSGCEVSEKLYERYRPNVALVERLEAAFGGVYEKWMPLPELLRRVGPEVVAQLPYRGPAAITYFAQMQHRFAFAVRQVPSDGGAATGGMPSAPQFTTEAAVLLRKPGYSGLAANNTPTPKSFQVLISLVPADMQVDVDIVRRQLTSDVQAELDSYYGGLEGFFAAHKSVFFIPPETPTVVMRTRYRLRTQRAKLPLEEQLRIALDARDKPRIRIIRRKIAFRDNPSHPLHDPENLAKEVSKHLPRRGFVSLKTMMKRNLPEELLMYMPRRLRSFFNNYPQYFTQFEYQSAGTWCICRPDQPLPRGVIRQNFSDGDLLRLIAELLQQRGARAASWIHTNLPFGAQEVVRRRYGGVYFFVVRYPQYFNVVLKTERENVKSSAVVHLIQVPSRELSDAALAASAASSNNPNAPSHDGEDHENGTDEDGEDYLDDGLD